MKLIYIFNDQLNLEVSSLHNVNKDEDIIVLTETFEQAKSVKHHKKKLIFMFSAMRHFANSLRKQGYKVHYSKIDDESNPPLNEVPIFKSALRRSFVALYNNS